MEKKLWKRCLRTLWGYYPHEITIQNIRRDNDLKPSQVHTALRQLKSWNLIKTRKVWDFSDRIPRSELKIIILPSQEKRVWMLFRKK